MKTVLLLWMTDFEDGAPGKDTLLGVYTDEHLRLAMQHAENRAKGALVWIINSNGFPESRREGSYCYSIEQCTLNELNGEYLLNVFG